MSGGKPTTERKPPPSRGYSRAPLLLAALLGLAAVVVPVWLTPGILWVESPLFPIVATGWKRMGALSVVLLGLAGFLPATITDRHPVGVGLATMGLFPALSIAEMVRDPTSHNLFPLEWMAYFFATIPGICGAYVGAGVRHLVQFLVAKLRLTK